MEFFTIYLYVTLSTIAHSLSWVLAIIGVMLSLSLLYVAGETKDELDEIIAAWKRYFPLKSFILLVALAILLPSKQNLKLIVGGGLVWKATSYVAEGEWVDKVPSKWVDAMLEFTEGTKATKEGVNKDD